MRMYVLSREAEIGLLARGVTTCWCCLSTAAMVASMLLVRQVLAVVATSP
jgi:hypothetical protein